MTSEQVGALISLVEILEEGGVEASTVLNHMRTHETTPMTKEEEEEEGLFYHMEASLPTRTETCVLAALLAIYLEKKGESLEEWHEVVEVSQRSEMLKYGEQWAPPNKGVWHGVTVRARPPRPPATARDRDIPTVSSEPDRP